MTDLWWCREPTGLPGKRNERTVTYGVSVDTPSARLAPWQRTAAGAGLLAADGSVAATVFAEMSALAVSTGAINLGQGFPDEDGPREVLDAARDAIAAGVNQYPPGPGMPVLREAIAANVAPLLAVEAMAVALRTP